MVVSEGEMGRLERVDLRDAWKSEAGDFTPWLAKEDNIKLLADAIGVGDLEVEAQEKNVGRYRADILCRDTEATDRWVLIENQLERTDHIHLGQLITYAAGLDAATIVWVSRQFTDEHRAALDWLNEITPEKILFFGVEIELWRIGSSPIAPKFNVVSKPNDWTKPSGELRSRRYSEGLTDTQRLQLEYWRAFREFMERRGGSIKPTKPHPQQWMTFSIGRTGFLLYTVVGVRDGKIGVQLVIQGSDAKAHYNLLEGQRETIETEVDERFEWQELRGRKESHIEMWNEYDPKDQQGWQEQHRWLFDKLQVFHRVFAERVKALRIPEG